MIIKMKNKISKSTRKSQQFMLIGLTGIFVVMFWNVLAQVVFQLNEAEFFQTDWWAVWFPNYAVWSSLFIAGIFKRYQDNNSAIPVNECLLLQHDNGLILQNNIKNID